MASMMNTRLLSVLVGICALTVGCDGDRPSPSYPPEITSSSRLPNARVGRVYSVSLTARGGKMPLRWSGSAPANLKLEPHSGEITGTPDRSGSFHFEVTVTDSANPAGSDTKTFDLTISPGISLAILNESPLPNAVINQPYSASLQAAGGQGKLHWSSSNLTDDFTLDPDTGAITVTCPPDRTILCTPDRIGRFTFDLRVTDKASRCVSKRFVLEVLGE